MEHQTESFNSSQAFEVSLELFDGPIDLLLHLVKQNELPLEKVSLAVVAEQYLETIRSYNVQNIQNYDIEIAGEYLVIAATLVSLKGSILLNEPVTLVPDDEGNMVDPHDELLARLKEAQVYREQAHNLAMRPMLNIDVFASPGMLDKLPAGPITWKPHNAFTLGEAFRKIIKAASTAMRYTVTLESVSVVQRMMHVVDTLKRLGNRVLFGNLLEGVTTKAGVAATFVALLELCKRSMIDVQQNDLNGEITVMSLDAKATDVAATPAVRDEAAFDSEFDAQSLPEDKTANS